MIYITGDTHGDIDLKKISLYFGREYSNEKDVLFILGDGGFVWDKSVQSIQKLLMSTKATVIYIDGNHENFDLLNDFPVVTKFGAKMHKITDRLFHVLRGEIAIVNGLKFLCLGGATSIDKARRKNHESWWEAENISDDDIANALSNLEKCNHQVDYVLTHCAPSSIVSKLGYSTDQNTDILETLSKKICFSQWYFGHYHIDKRVNYLFVCFYQEIKKLNVINEGKKEATANCYIEEPDGYLYDYYAKAKTQFTSDDLPEYYYHYYLSNHAYMKAIGIIDLAFKEAPSENPYEKDLIIYLSYSKKLPHNEKYEPINIKDWDHCINNVRMNEFVSILEKYNPDLDLHKLKKLFNLNSDRYVNCSDYNWNNLSTHPYPEEKPIFFKGSNYYVSQGNLVYGVFVNLEDAKKMAELILSKSNMSNYEEICKDENGDLYFGVSIYYPNICVKKIRPEDISENFSID